MKPENSIIGITGQLILGVLGHLDDSHDGFETLSFVTETGIIELRAEIRDGRPIITVTMEK